MSGRVLPEALLRWYAQRGRSLPWRRTQDPYAIWVSEVLLQQTRAEVVVPYYQRFLQAFPTVASLAAADLEEVLRVWEGLGYYARARHLHRAARRIVAQGGFPTTAEGWRHLPGVGPYTAAAVASIAFGQDVLALDGNVLRVGARLLGILDPIDEGRTQKRIREALERLLPQGQAGAFNQALMDLGSGICLPRRPRCGECPVRAWCVAAQRGLQDRIPRRRTRAGKPLRSSVALVLRDPTGRVLLVRRPLDGVWGGLWALPETEARGWRAAKPALEGLLGVRLRKRRTLTRLRHAFTHFVATYTVVEVEASAPPRTGRFVRPEAPEVPVPVPTRKVLSRLARPGAPRPSTGPGPHPGPTPGGPPSPRRPAGAPGVPPRP